jgi:hypothetical protein
MISLISRLRSLNRHAPFWSQLWTCGVRFDREVSEPSAFVWLDADDMPDDEWIPMSHEAWDKVDQREEAFVQLIDDLASSMRPPSNELAKRVWSWLKARMAKRGPSPQLTEDQPPEIAEDGAVVTGCAPVVPERPSKEASRACLRIRI